MGINFVNPVAHSFHPARKLDAASKVTQLKNLLPTLQRIASLQSAKLVFPSPIQTRHAIAVVETLVKVILLC